MTAVEPTTEVVTTAWLLRLLIATPLVAWLPGRLAWRALGAEGTGDVDGPERVFLDIFVSLIITAGLATLLAELGSLSLLSLLAGLTLTCLVLAAATASIRRFEISDLRFLISNLKSQISNLKSDSAGLLVVLILAAGLFFRPAEALLVMDDAGVYVIRGLTLADSGRLTILDPLLPSLPAGAQAQLLPFVRYESSYTRHVGAFHIWHMGRGLVQPSFFHLPSIWMAVSALIAGPRAALWATPLAGLLAVGGLALLGRRLFGPTVGLAAALLLTWSFPQVWYARYPTSEIFAQAWLLGGLFLLALFLQHRHRFFGVAAGLSLGQLWLIRVDAWVAALAIGLCFAGWLLTDQRPSEMAPRPAGDRWFGVPFGLSLAWAGLHAALFAPAYVISLMHLYLTPRLGAIAILSLAGLLVGAFALAYRSTIWQIAERRPGWWPAVGAGTSLWVAGTIAAGTWAAVSIAGTRASVGADAVQWLSWYLTPLGLTAAAAGLLLMARQGASRPAQVMLLTALLYALLYLPDPRANPAQPWGVRRFVPAVLPALSLGMAYLAARFPVPAPERLRPALRAGLILSLAVVLARNVQPILTHNEYAGTWAQVEALANRFEPGAVVLFNLTGVGQAIAPPLAYLYARPTFVLQAETPDTQVIAALVEQWSGDGRPVYLALTGLAPWLADLGVAATPVGDFQLRFARLERPMARAPRQTEVQDWQLDLYRLAPAGRSETVRRLEMGPGELAYLVAGFYGREISPGGVSFRWTDGEGRLRLPAASQVRQLELRIAGPPAGAPPVALTLLLDGAQVGHWEQPHDFTVRTVNVPATATSDGWLDIELRSEAWVPQQAGLGEDSRRLGVVVDWIEVKE